MRFILLFLFTFLFSGYVLSQMPVTTPTPIAVSNVIMPATVLPTPTPSPVPAWLPDAITTAEKLPIIGPYIVKALAFIVALFTIMTALVGCILTILRALTAVLSYAQLGTWIAKIQAFRDSKLMYWLMTISYFNGKKPEEK